MKLDQTLLKTKMIQLFVSCILLATSSAKAENPPLTLELPENGLHHITIKHHENPRNGISYTMDFPPPQAGLPPLHFDSLEIYPSGKTIGCFVQTNHFKPAFMSPLQSLRVAYKFHENGVSEERWLVCVIPQEYIERYSIKVSNNNPRIIRFTLK
jgi:hypothetical protein